MKIQSSTRSRWDWAALSTCLAIMLMGLAVLVGWHAHVRAAVQIFRGLVPMQYNTALCFLALGAAGASLLTGRRLFLLGGGIVAMLMGAAVIVEYATGISFGIDTLFFQPWEHTLTADPGRMALTTAISFFLCGSVLVILAVRQGAYAIFAIVNSIPLSLALASLVGYSFQITYVLPFRLGSQMALPTCAAFLAYGIAMLGYAWKHAERGADGLPKWCVGIGAAFLPVLLVGASAAFPKQSWRVVPLEVLFSVIVVALITVAVLKLSQAKVLYKGLLMIAVPLILLLIFVGLVVGLKHQSESAQVLALHSKEVIGVSQSLLGRLSEAESAVRGYVITDDETFVNSYETSLESVTRTTAKFQQLVSDNPLEEASARKIDRLTAQRMDRLSKIVGLMKTGNKTLAEEYIKEGSGEDLMQQIRAEMKVFSQEQDRLDADRQQVLDTSWQKLSWLLVAGTAAAILLASILTLLFSGGISRRLQQLRTNAINLAAGKELAPSLTGHDEIAELDRVFHEMAESLDEVTRLEKAVIEGTTDGVFVKDLEQRFVMVNQAAANLLGKTAKEIIGASIHDLFAPESVLRILELDAEIFAEGKTTTNELPLANKGGVERTFLSTRAPYHDRQGNIVGMIGINRDITERKQLENTLRQERVFLRTLIDSIPDSVYVKDLDCRKVIANLAEVRISGLQSEVELLGKDDFAVYPKELAEKFFADDQMVLQTGQAVVNREEYVLTEDGQKSWLLTTKIPLRDERGQIVGLMGLGRNVTKRKLAEEALIESDRRFRDLFYDAPIGYHEIDIEGRITCVNTTELSMLGYTSEEMIGHHVWEFIKEAEIARATFAEKLAGNKALGNVERSFRRKDGTYLEVQLDDQMLKDPNGRFVGIRATMQNIVERKRTEEALRQSEQRFRDLIENASDVIYTADFDGNFTSLNRSGERMTGYTREEALNLNFSQVVSPETFKLVREMTERKLASHDETVYELEFFKKSGESLLVEVSSRAIFKDGKPVGIQGIGRDITQRKQVEAELKQARDAALESLRLKAEFLANMSHEIRTPMNGVIGMTGLLLETDLTSTQREFTENIESSAEVLLTIINDILDFSKIEAGLLRFETIDFELRGAVENTVELLAETAQAKGLELASIVYRDVPTALRGDPGRLRQVLTNLIGNAAKFTDRGEVVVSVTKISETTSHAMLRFEIQDTGIGISPEAQRGLFHAFIQADGSTTRKYGGTGLGLAISKQLVELMGGEIGIESTPGLGSTFWFTATFQKQLTPALTATEAVGSLNGARVLIVDDNATNRSILNHQTSSWGMLAAEAQSGEQALELLRAGAAQGECYDIAMLDLKMPLMDGFQLAEAIKSDPAIAGVALVLLPSFGKRGHGERASQAGISAYLQKPVRQSQLYDCLTTVMARSDNLPVAASMLVTQHSMRESHLLHKDKSFSTVRIIIAEDNLVNQKVALGQLYNLGYRAEAVANGRELLELLENGHVDIILMDCQMPEMDGFAATAEIRRREGAARHTTIIAMTANALEGDNERCLAAGMDDYLSKPVKSDVLRLKLERWTKSGEPGKSVEDNEAVLVRDF